MFGEEEMKGINYCINCVFFRCFSYDSKRHPPYVCRKHNCNLNMGAVACKDFKELMSHK